MRFEWTKVVDAMPPEGADVFVVCSGLFGTRKVVATQFKDGAFVHGAFITHWMIQPEIGL